MEGEQLIGGIASNWLKKSGAKLFGYGLYATDKRLIGIKMRKGAAVWALAGPVVGYFLGKAVTQVESDKKLQELEQKKDFEIGREQISRIEIKKPGTFRRGHIKIITKSGSDIDIISSNKKDFGPLRNLLKAFLPDALTVQE